MISMTSNTEQALLPSTRFSPRRDKLNATPLDDDTVTVSYTATSREDLHEFNEYPPCLYGGVKITP